MSVASAALITPASPAPETPETAGVASPKSRRAPHWIIGFLVRRIGLLLLVLVGVMTFLFVLSRASGDPAAIFSAPEATEEQLEQTRVRLGLDQPVLIQYFNTIIGAFAFRFGDSFAFQQDAFGLVITRIGPSLALVMPGLVIGAALAFVVGIYAALRQSKARSRFLMSVVIIIDGIPYFLLALVLVLVFAISLRVLPATGSAGIENMILPITVLTVGSVATLSRIVRGQIIDALAGEHVLMARSKGIDPRRVLFTHALPTALPPIIAFMGILFSFMVGTLLILEPIFNYGGVGSLLVRSVTSRDFTLVQASVFFIALLITSVNILADLIVRILDPRLRSEVSL
jgi:ABC-type dipeptide/oligopeptide/nickel transport system permease component